MSEIKTALFGIVVGAVLGGAITALLELWRNSKQSKRIAKAIAGEISAVLHIAKRRNYVQALRQFEVQAREHQNVCKFSVTVSEDYLSVLRVNIANVGLLKGELPVMIPQFLTMTKSIFEDFKRLHKEFEMLGNNPILIANFYNELIELMEDARTKGEAIIVEVSRLYH